MATEAKQIEDIAVLIQARLGSQRCPQKMIRSFAGSTLTDIAIEKILASNIIPKSNFYLAVHEKELIEIAHKHKVNAFVRSEKSANSEGTPMTEMYEWWNKLPYKYVILVNACAPMLTTETIDEFVKAYMNSESNGMFGVVEKRNYFWNQEGALINAWPDGEAVMNTKVVAPTLEAAHCLYAGKLEDIGQDIWMGDFQKSGDIELFSMKEEEIFDIDHEWEFNLYEALYKATETS